jgi:hypothetical protein
LERLVKLGLPKRRLGLLLFSLFQSITIRRHLLSLLPQLSNTGNPIITKIPVPIWEIRHFSATNKNKTPTQITSGPGFSSSVAGDGPPKKKKKQQQRIDEREARYDFTGVQAFKHASLTQLRIDIELHGLEKFIDATVSTQIASPSQGIGYWRIYSLNIDHEEPAIQWLLQKQNVGLIYLADTKHTTPSILYARKRWLKIDEKGKVLGTTTTDKMHIGGAMVFMSSEYAQCYCKSWEDPSH